MLTKFTKLYQGDAYLIRYSGEQYYLDATDEDIYTLRERRGSGDFVADVHSGNLIGGGNCGYFQIRVGNDREFGGEFDELKDAVEYILNYVN